MVMIMIIIMINLLWYFCR